MPFATSKPSRSACGKRNENRSVSKVLETSAHIISFSFSPTKLRFAGGPIERRRVPVAKGYGSV